MSKNLKKIACLLLALVCLLGVAACGNTSTDGQTAPAQDASADNNAAETNGEVVVNVAMNSPWTDLMPYNSAQSGNYNGFVTGIMYERLAYICEGEISPRGADSWEIAEDKLSITFNLNHDVMWSDGEPVTANDYRFAAEMITDPDCITVQKATYNILIGTDASGNSDGTGLGIEVIDDYTIKYSFKERISEAVTFPCNFYAWIALPEHAMADIAPADYTTADIWNAPITNGPLMFESTVAGNELVLVANKDYHLGAPTFDKFIIHVMATTNASSAMLAGDIDFCYPFLSHDELELLESYDYITTVRRDIPSISSYIVINQLVYDDYRLNKAIDLAIDRDVIAAMLGDAEPIESFIMSNTKYYDDTCTYTYDPEAAKALVDEMAAEGTFNPNDPFYICCGSSSEDLANLIASYLQAVGINASISMMEGTTMIAGLHSTDVGCGLLSKDMAANPMWMKNLLTSKTSTTINTTSDVWDVFYERFMAASSEDEEIAIVKEMQQTWLEQEPYIFYAARYSDYCYNSRLGDNVNLQALENYNLAVWEWDVH